jgi:hypothetical protein
VTPAYVDPVVARGGAPGPASDVFGVAAAAFHALTGIAPWNAADARGMLAVAAAGELPDLALLAPEAPEELVRVLRRGLSPEPHQRGSAAAFALDLRQACRPEPVRLPVAGVPDAELGRTGRGPRTELTHQVPGHRPRAAHAAPAHAGRLARVRAGLAARTGLDGGPGLGGLLGGALRRLVVVGAVLVAVAAGLAGAAWAGASWGGREGDPLPAAETARATGHGDGTGAPAEKSAGAPTPGPTDGAGPPPDAGAGVSVADRATAPDDHAGWTALLSELYARRAAAFTTADPTVLPGVDLPGSALLERDTGQVSGLVAAGQTLEDFAPQVRRLLSVTPVGEDRVVLRLVDELPGYRVVPVAGPGAAPVQEVAGRGEAEVRIVVERTAAGWRISDAQVER